MARCGCRGVECNCLVHVFDTETLDLFITGNGTADFPYEISGDVQNVETYLEIAPESCLTIIGDGSFNQPFELTTTASQDDIAAFTRTDILTAPYTGVGRYLFPYSATIIGVTAAVNTAPVGSSIIIDVNKNGTTIFTAQINRPTILSGTNDTGGSEVVPDVTSLVFGDYLTVDIDQVGSGTPGSDLTVFVHYTRLIVCP